MKFGLRFSLLLLLGALMLLSYLPLYFATSTYTRLGLDRLQRENAVKLGRSVASQLVAVRRDSPTEEAFLNFVRAQLHAEAIHAVSVLDRAGRPAVVLGDPQLLEVVFHEKAFGQQPAVREVSTERGSAVVVYQPSLRGGVATAVRVDPEITRSSKLSALMGLYMAVGAFATLVVAYFALTRWIVRPILVMERGADRVASGARRLRPVENAPRELTNLSQRLSEMTAKIRDEEESLRKKIEEVQTRTEELRLAQQSLVHSERLATVGRLAAGLAHEVGNPISALMGFLELMRAGDLSPEEQQDFVKRMQRETARIDRVLSDLLAYARSGKKKLGAAHTPSPVGPAVDNVVALLSPQRAFTQIVLEKDVASGLPLVALTQEELTQVLLNLVMNAAHACDEKGTITIRATLFAPPEPPAGPTTTRSSTLEQERRTHVRLCVEDDGPGICEDVRETLFEPFVTTKEVGRGTGLGLSVTKGIIEGAGGSITVEPVLPHGARFVLELPVVAPALALEAR